MRSNGREESVVALSEDLPEHQHSFATADDELGLAQERAKDTDGLLPDTLEVRSDSLEILQGSMERIRLPMLIAGAVGGAIVLVLVAAALVGRIRRPPLPTAS
jgi:hypothetical protein